ncbi:MAG: hypothetical protein IJA86_00415 [Clostridia bacterium]|nr:hypothetical protein [Clostridia bacterium]
MKVVKLISKIFLIALGSVIALFLLAWLSLHVAKYFMYSDYYKQRENVSRIPGLNDGFVPQGLDYDAETDTYIHSGYNGKHIEIYFVKGKETKKLIPVTDSGAREEGHAGGVTRAGDYLYVCDNANEGNGRAGLLRIYRFEDLLKAEDGAEIRAISTFDVDTSSSFCFSDDSYIYVGEFYRPENYETAESHYYTTPAGDQNKAILSAYPLNADGSIIGEYPEFSVSIPAQVQGFAVTADGKIAISTSWGLTPSHLEIHSGKKDSGTTISVSGKEVPLYYIDSTTREKDIVMPAFSEGLAILDDKVVISFESACNKYVIGKLFFATKIVSFPMK